MNKIKNTMLIVLLCCTAMLKAQFNVPNLAEFDYTPVYDQSAKSASLVDNGGMVTPFQGGLLPNQADAVTPVTPSTPNTDGGNGTGVIPEPIADGFWILSGLACLFAAYRVRRCLKEE